MKSLARKLIAVGLVLVLALLLVAAPVSAQGQVHVVQHGETVYSIARRYGMTPQAIVSANGLANGNYIYVGQRLTISSSGGGAVVASSGGAYTVRVGDTLASIAARHGTTPQAIVSANGLANANYIYVGQRLTIPGDSSSTGPASVGTGQTNGGAYVVRHGDTLASIAYRHGTTAQAIANASGLANPNHIYPGQRLTIPAGGGKRIVVDLSAQRMYVYQGGQLLWNWVISTGRPGQETAVGHYKVQNKIPNAYAYTWSLQMPHWLGIYWAGSLQNGIHALPIQSDGNRLWAGYLGTPVSFGCVILGTQNAATLYNWAPVGTLVDVVW